MFFGGESLLFTCFLFLGNSFCLYFVFQRTDCKAVISVLPGQVMGSDGFQMSVTLSEVHLPRMWVEKHPDKNSQVCLSFPLPHQSVFRESRYWTLWHSTLSELTLYFAAGLHAGFLPKLWVWLQLWRQWSCSFAGHVWVHEGGIVPAGPENRPAGFKEPEERRQNQHRFVWNRLVKEQRTD